MNLSEAPCSYSCLVPSTLPFLASPALFPLLPYVERVILHEVIYSKFTLFLFPSVLYHYSHAVNYIMNNWDFSDHVKILFQIFSSHFSDFFGMYWALLPTPTPHWFDQSFFLKLRAQVFPLFKGKFRGRGKMLEEITKDGSRAILSKCA